MANTALVTNPFGWVSCLSRNRERSDRGLDRQDRALKALAFHLLIDYLKRPQTGELLNDISTTQLCRQYAVACRMNWVSEDAEQPHPRWYIYTYGLTF